MNSIEEAEQLIEQIEQLKKRAVPIAKKMIELETGREPWIDEDDIVIKCGDLVAIDSYSCCGSYDEQSYTIPLWYLFDKDWEEQATKRIEQRKLAEQKRKEREKEEREKKAQERKYNEYLKLKEQFEGGGG